ncbi:MAG: DDE-type integrase/transposase/recombinase, partial [Planctomycetes bacterium]|nr:DDE-type integrase/transposase/recombinase [Planctomycetota bacterium]
MRKISPAAAASLEEGWEETLTVVRLGIPELLRKTVATTNPIEVAWSFTACRVVEVLQYLFAVRGAPEHIRSDSGPEFVAQEVTRWLDRAMVKTLFIAKGSPWENGYA